MLSSGPITFARNLSQNTDALAMTAGTSGSQKPTGRVYALDALRGLAILGMILSGQLLFGENALPSWMYHAQVPPPAHKWIGTLPGITWVDLVFPFFIFARGAAICGGRRGATCSFASA